MKRWKKMLSIAMLAAMTSCGAFAMQAMPVQAAYVQIDAESAGTIGDYYYKTYEKNGLTRLAISKTKNGTYTKTPVAADAISDGKTAYYVEKNVLYRYSFSSKTKTRLKTLGSYSEAGDTDFWRISAKYGNTIYLTRTALERETHTTYAYRLDTKGLQKLKSSCNLVSVSGSYAASMDEYRSHADPGPTTLYRLTEGGLQKIKRLARYGHDPVFHGNYLYYTVYPNEMQIDGRAYPDTAKEILYRANRDGSHPQKLGVFTAKGGFVYIGEIQSKTCIVTKDGKNYKYTYATKKLTKCQD